MKELTKFDLYVKRDLEKVDSVFTQIIRDRSQWDEFFRDPNGVLVKHKLHPPATKEANDRVNRVFYSCLANKELLELMNEIFENFQEIPENKDYHADGLQKGVIQNLFEHDLNAVHHFFYTHTDKAKKAYQIVLYDANEKGILTKKYSKDEIDSYIDEMLDGVQKGLSVEELPVLEKWDEYYGVGTGYGIGEAEVGPAVTVGVAVEAVVVATVAIPVAVLGASLNAQNLQRSLNGSSDEIERTRFLSGMFGFMAELSYHINNFERRV